MSARERLGLIRLLSQYSKLGYDGSARRDFLLAIGFEEKFIAEKVALGASTQDEYAVRLVTGLMNFPGMLPLILQYLLNDQTYAEANKILVRGLILKFGAGDLEDRLA